MPRSSQHIEASSRLKSQMKENHWVKNTQVLHAGVMYHCKGDEVCLFWIKTLGWLLMVQSHWDVNRKGKLAWFYVHQRGFFVPWSFTPWTFKHFSDVPGVTFACGRPCLMWCILEHLRHSSFGLQVGQSHLILCVRHMVSITLKLLLYGYALPHDKKAISIQSYS